VELLFWMLVASKILWYAELRKVICVKAALEACDGGLANLLATEPRLALV